MAMEHKFAYVSGVAMDVAWKMMKKGDELLPKVLPAYFAKIDIVEGDGGAGTLRLVTLGEGVGPEGAGQVLKERVEVMDESTHTVSYSIIEGGDPGYLKVHFTVQFSPVEKNSTTVQWTMNYTPINKVIPPPKHMELMAEAPIKALEAYAKEHATEFL